MYTQDINLILSGINLVMNATVWVILMKMWRVKFRIEKAVGPVPPVQTPPPQITEAELRAIYNKVNPVLPPAAPTQTTAAPAVAETPAEVKGGEPARKSNTKAQKQINLLTAELERLKAL